MNDFDPERPDLCKHPRFTASGMATGVEPSEFIGAYVADYDVPCGVCRYHRLHRNGGWVRCSDGSIVLCGADCCQDIPGGDIARKIRAGVERIKRTRARERVIAPLTDGLPEVLERLEYWIPEEVRLESVISRLIFATSSYDDDFQINQHVTSTGTIDRVRIEPFMDRGRRQVNRVLLGRTHGAAVLTMADRSFVKAGKKLTMIRERTEAPKMDERTLALVSIVRSDTVFCLIDGVRRFELAKRFFERENIEELARWFSVEMPAVRIGWAGDRRAISITNKAGRFGEVSDEIGVPDFSEMPTVEMLVDPLRRKQAA